MGTKKTQTAGNRLSSPGVRRGTNIQVVTELELVEIQTMRLSSEALAKSLKKTTEELEAKERNVIDRLNAGATVQGQMKAHVGEETGRASPSWKTEHVVHMFNEHNIDSKSLEAQVLAKYPGKTKQVLVLD
jgi:hypothetical protein